ncbi:hypothetical protein [Pedobacter sp.]
MMNRILLIMLCGSFLSCATQQLKFVKRKANALSGSEFAKSIADTSLTLEAREQIIFTEVKNGNVPDFYRKPTTINITQTISGKLYQLSFQVAPDYLLIGNDEDFFYTPTTPMLAQKIASLSKAMLPTKKMVDDIYSNALIRLAPQPIPPSKLMTTVPVFIAHNNIVIKQLDSLKKRHLQSELTGGHKKDIIISNKIYGQPTPRVVIYGWHKLDGKAIQPVYNKHTNTWADYSHGVRLVLNDAILNGKKVKLSAILKDPLLHILLSDEGIIENPTYPTTN